MDTKTYPAKHVEIQNVPGTKVVVAHCPTFVDHEESSPWFPNIPKLDWVLELPTVLGRRPRYDQQSVGFGKPIPQNCPNPHTQKRQESYLRRKHETHEVTAELRVVKLVEENLAVPHYSSLESDLVASHQRSPPLQGVRHGHKGNPNPEPLT